MIKEERHAYILDQISQHNKVSSQDLIIRFDVSGDTIRRDLLELSKKGMVRKVHGGAISEVLFTFNVPNVSNTDKEIARKAKKLIQEEMVVLTDGGKPMWELAHMLPDTISVTFITISPETAMEIAKHSSIKVIMVGGELSKKVPVNIGAGVINFLDDIRADICLISSRGLSVLEGATDMDWDVAQVKKAMIRSSKKLAILATTEKLDSVHPIKICSLNQLSYLVTELSPDSARLENYREQGFKLV